MNISENLQRIITAKTEIKSALLEKGIDVGEGTIDTYAVEIQNADIAGGDSKPVLPNGICLSGSTWSEFHCEDYDWRYVRDYISMFEDCTSLKTISGLNTLDLSKTTTLNSMFSGCSGLTSLDISTWDTSNVVDMTDMFYQCKGLTSLDLSSWDTSNVVDMNYLFSNCQGLKSLDLSSWDTSNVTNMSYMFGSCIKLTSVKMGGDVSKVTNVGSMFNNISTTGTFYYNSQYDYSNIIAVLPSNWTAVPME